MLDFLRLLTAIYHSVYHVGAINQGAVAAGMPGCTRGTDIAPLKLLPSAIFSGLVHTKLAPYINLHHIGNRHTHIHVAGIRSG